MAVIPVVLDVDTGVDDACALLLAALHPGLHLCAVTCVGGNAPLADVVRNTLTVLETAGRADVPVGIGASRPLVEDPIDARHVHGADGMADLGMPHPTMAADDRNALDLLRTTVDAAALSGDRATVVALAPMTNLALLARVHPESFGRIGRVVFMGGGVNISNATAAAEFNVFHDPEAAAMVLDACAQHGIPIVMYGLDVFYAPMVTNAQVEGLRAVETPVARLAAGLISFHHRRFATDGATIGDAGAVAMLVAPQAVRTEHLSVRIELTGTWTRGRTVVDRRDWSGHLDHDPHGLAPAMVDVALDVDGPVVSDAWLRTVRGDPS
jgi:pyrimidine-specific ribonucleoside hydrolase